MAADAIVHVIDDDEAVRQSLEFLLRAARVPTRTYDSAAAFLSALPTMETGCVITDIRMPDISGIELLRRLGEMQVKLPVIVITGHSERIPRRGSDEERRYRFPRKAVRG